MVVLRPTGPRLPVIPAELRRLALGPGAGVAGVRRAEHPADADGAVLRRRRRAGAGPEPASRPGPLAGPAPRGPTPARPSPATSSASPAGRPAPRVLGPDRPGLARLAVARPREPGRDPPGRFSAWTPTDPGAPRRRLDRLVRRRSADRGRPARSPPSRTWPTTAPGSAAGQGVPRRPPRPVSRRPWAGTTSGCGACWRRWPTRRRSAATARRPDAATGVRATRRHLSGAVWGGARLRGALVRHCGRDSGQWPLWAVLGRGAVFGWNDPTAAGRDAALRLGLDPGRPAFGPDAEPVPSRTEFPEPAVPPLWSSSAPARCWPRRGAGGGYLPGPARRRPAAGRRAGATALVRHRRARVERAAGDGHGRVRPKGLAGRCASTRPGSSRRGPGRCRRCRAPWCWGCGRPGGRSWPTRTTPTPTSPWPTAYRVQYDPQRRDPWSGAVAAAADHGPAPRCWLACRWPRGPGPADRGPGPAGRTSSCSTSTCRRGSRGNSRRCLRPDLALEEMRVVVVRLLPWARRDSRPSRCRPR